MKGRKLVLIACVFVLSIAGIGYSAWTEGLSIKSILSTGRIHMFFANPAVYAEGLEIEVDVDNGVLAIYGTLAEDAPVLVEFDIYNDVSSLPVKYDSDNEDLPEGITLYQGDTVIRPGEYLRGNQLTLVPGENELVLTFIQYNANGGGWKEKLKIYWNIAVAEEIVEPELNLTTDGAITGEELIEDSPSAETPDKEDTPSEEPDKDVTDKETGSDTGTGSNTGSDSTPDSDNPAAPDNAPDHESTPDPAKNPTEEPATTEQPETGETPDESPSANESSNEKTTESKTQTETNEANSIEHAEADKGSVENVGDGEE